MKHGTESVISGYAPPVSRIVKRMMTNAGLDHKGYGAHSLRIANLDKRNTTEDMGL